LNKLPSPPDGRAAGLIWLGRSYSRVVYIVPLFRVLCFVFCVLCFVFRSCFVLRLSCLLVCWFAGRSSRSCVCGVRGAGLRRFICAAGAALRRLYSSSSSSAQWGTGAASQPPINKEEEEEEDEDDEDEEGLSPTHQCSGARVLQRPSVSTLTATLLSPRHAPGRATNNAQKESNQQKNKNQKNKKTKKK